MKTIDREKLQSRYTISKRYFIFDRVLDEYQEKNKALSKEEKKELYDIFVEVQNHYVKTLTKKYSGNETIENNIKKRYKIDSVNQEHLEQYFVDMLDRESVLPQVINRVFKEENYFPIVNNEYTQEAHNRWNRYQADFDNYKMSYPRLHRQFILNQCIEEYNIDMIKYGYSQQIIPSSIGKKMGARLEEIIGEKIDVSLLSKEFNYENLKKYINLPDNYRFSSDDKQGYNQYNAENDKYVIMKAIDTIFEEYVGKEYFSNNMEEYKRINDWFKNTTLFDKDKLKKIRSVEFDRFVPLSPFDPAFANKEAFLRSGNEFVWLDLETMDDIESDSDIRLFRYNRDRHVIDTYDRRTGTSLATQKKFFFLTEKYMTERKECYTTECDKTNLSALLPYISKKDLDGETYDSLNRFINSSTEEQRLDNASIQKAVAILKHLQDNGVNYNIQVKKNGSNEETINAKIVGRPYAITIVNPKYKRDIGSIYNSATSMYVKLGVDTMQKSIQNDSEYETEDIIKMIDYVLKIGDEEEKSASGKRIGLQGKYMHQGKKLFNESYYQDGQYRCSISERNNNTRTMAFFNYPEYRNKPMNFYLSEEKYSPNNILDYKQKKNLEANEYLQNAVISAQSNVIEQVNLDELVSKYLYKKENNLEEEIALSYDKEIAAIQTSYVNFMKEQSIDKIKNHQDAMKDHLKNFVECNYIGTYELNYDTDKRFDVARVSKYMDSDVSAKLNRKNLVSALSFLHIPAEELLGNEFQNKAIKNMMLNFHISQSEEMLTSSNEFIKDVGEEVKNAILEAGCNVKDSDIRIDENGMIAFDATRLVRKEIKNNNNLEGKVHVQLGQVFVPDEDGVIKTAYYGTDNYATIPGNELYVVGTYEDGPLNERIRIRTYKDLIRREARILVHEALWSGEPNYHDALGFKKVYSKLKSEHWSLDFKEEKLKSGMSQQALDAIMHTARLQCTWENAAEIRDSSTLFADFKNQDVRELLDGSLSTFGINQIVNDNSRDVYKIMGKNNISQLGHWVDGLFDVNMTSGAKNQGINLYLNSEAKIVGNKIIPTQNVTKQVPVLEQMKFCDFDAWDRIQMAAGNYMRSIRIAEKTKVAQMEFGGWTFDDGYVISREFAEKYKVHGRNLLVGDKLSDIHSNKGVITLIVDRDADINPVSYDYVADNLEIDVDSFENYGKKAKGKCILDEKEYVVTIDSFPIDEMKHNGLSPDVYDKMVDYVVTKENKKRDAEKNAVLWFRANPELEVVGAPYSPVSRNNGGTARELAQNTMDLNDPYDTSRKLPNAMGECDIMITIQTVDEKTHTYTDEDYWKGTSRKASAQLAWALNSKNLDKVMKEFYSSNNSSFEDFREYLITFGFDIDNKGNFLPNYTPQENEVRNTARLQTDYIRHKMTTLSDGTKVEDESKLYEFNKDLKKEAIAIFAKQLETAGFMEIPFPIKLKNGEMTPQLENGFYRLPVLAKHLRNENFFDDGQLVEHQYTNNYTSIFVASMNYLKEKKNLEILSQKKHLTASECVDVEKAKKEFTKCKGAVQKNYSIVANEIENKFNKKTNYIKESIMKIPLKKSSTTVLTANPYLDLDQVAVSPDIAANKNLCDDDYMLVWRDPILRDTGVRYLRVVIDERLQSCIAINPIIDKGFDADFDGDTTGNVKLRTKEADLQAKQLLTVEGNLLDYTTGGVYENGVPLPKELLLQNSLDVKSVIHNFPAVKEKINEYTQTFNDLEAQKNGGNLDKKKELLKEMSEFYRNVFKMAYVDSQHNVEGCYNCWDKDLKNHVLRLEKMVETGAKGSPKKLEEYCKYLGVAYETENEKIIPDSIRKYDKSFGMYDDTTPDRNGVPFNKRYEEDGVIPTSEAMKRQKNMNTQIATSIKSVGTGVAGAYSQRGMAVFRNLCAEDVLGITYPVSQASVQAKHDEVKARQMFKGIMGAARKCWNAELLEKKTDASGKDYWVPVLDEHFNPVKCNYGQFVHQMEEVYKSPYALNVGINMDSVRVIANYLADPEDVKIKKLQQGANFDINDCKMRGIEDEQVIEQYAKPMDQLAYLGKKDGAIKIISKLAKEGRNLYEGKFNAQFRPSVVQKNVVISENARAKDTEAVLDAKKAIDQVKQQARNENAKITNKEIVARVMEVENVNLSPSYLEKKVSEVNKETQQQRAIVSKETQKKNVAATQEKTIKRTMERIGVHDYGNDIEYDYGVY